MNKKNIKFPDLETIIYESLSMNLVWERYIKKLRESAINVSETESILFKLYASKLEEFLAMKDPEKLKELEQEFHSLKEKLRQLKIIVGMNFRLTRREKDFIGLNEKTRLFLKMGKPLEKLRDLLGFRIVICSQERDDLNSIMAAYSVMNNVLSFFINERNCLLAEAEPLVGIIKDEKEHTELYIPKESFIFNEFKDNVKDYILTPKKTGYQGLHAIIRKPNGLVFEIQVRTMAMDIRAEYGSAKHELHKKDRYEGEFIDIDLSKVNMPGFTVIDNDIVYDTIGLSKSVDPFNLI